MIFAGRATGEGKINDSRHNAIGILRSVSNTLSNSVNGEFEGI